MWREQLLKRNLISRRRRFRRIVSSVIDLSDDATEQSDSDEQGYSDCILDRDRLSGEHPKVYSEYDDELERRPRHNSNDDTGWWVDVFQGEQPQHEDVANEAD